MLEEDCHSRRRSSSSDGETFPNITSLAGSTLIIPDLEAKYAVIHSSSRHWFSILGRNLSFNLKQCFSLNLKAFYMNSSSPIYVMGKEYASPQLSKRIYKEIKHAMLQIIWVSYRSNFRPMHSRSGEVFTSDAGWGCTVRVGQMMLLNCLKKHFAVSKSECYEIIKTVEENLVNAPYSIHNLVEMASEGKSPGEWFSPSAICHAISQAVETFPIPGFRSIVCMDSLIYRDQVFAAACELPLEVVRNACMCAERQSKGICRHCGKEKINTTWMNSVLIMLPLMLGVSKIQHELYDAFKYLLRSPYTVGFIGGKPKSALYIVGYKENSVIILDPHFVQRSSISIVDFRRNYESYFNKKFMSIKMHELESSVSVGFYFRNREEFFCFEEGLLENREIARDVVFVKELTPEYLLRDVELPEENEDGFIVL